MVKRYRLESMPYAQANVGIEEVNGELIAVHLFSYNTRVVTIDLETRPATLYCTGTYSITTARHINRFTREFCGRNLYYECKAAVNPEHGYAEAKVNAQIDMREVLTAIDRYKEQGKRFYGKY